ncbi:MAG: hypothetical protein Q9168_004836 [Polycauliona sp. 1 TL-2023]
MQPYKYSSLNTQTHEIRLVTLLPKVECPSGIRVGLSTVALSDSSIPQYEALFYVWGSEEDPVSIRIQSSFSSLPDRSLNITRNLAEALTHLQHDQEPRVLWIDAICINQQYLEERGAQVTRMGDIYRLARQTLIWLGPEGDASHVAIQTLDASGSHLAIDWSTVALVPLTDDGLQFSDSQRRLPFDEGQWRGIESLLKRPWFRRLWIWQEVMLSLRAVLVCGFDIMPWHRFQAILFSFLYNEYRPIGMRVVLRLQDFCALPTTYTVTNPKIDLVRLLFRTRYSQCKDQRDRVYAILSMLHPKNNPELIPDYGRIVQSVFQEMVLERAAQGDLSLFKVCNSLYQLPNAPSWVPNLPTSIPPNLFNHLLADGGIGSEATYLGDGVLHVVGIFLTTIHNGQLIESNYLSDADQQVMLESLSIEIRRLASLILPAMQGNVYTRGGSTGEAFCRTIHFNYFSGISVPGINGVASFQDCFDGLLKFLKGPDNGLLTDPRIRDWLRVGTNLEEYTFFISKEGYMSLVSKTARYGDRVAIIPGCRAPMLLRPTEDGFYTIVGMCYIHGFGDGEALLGPPPPGWVVIRRHGQLNCLDRPTGEWHYNDLRLGPLPDGWRMSSVDHKGIVPIFYRPPDRTSTYQDPRRTVAGLRAQGVDIKSISLK